MKPVWHVVHGVVFSPSGVLPSPVFITVVKSSTPVPENAICANPDGRFEIRLPDGIFTLRAYAEGGQLSGEAEVSLPPPPSTPIAIQLQANT
jgi:hypothetical protein